MPAFHESINLALGNEQEAINALSALLPKSHQSLPALPLPPPQPPQSSTGILLGRLLPLSNGTLVISHGRRNYCQVVFAPPLSIRFRAALVYCSDFRCVRPHNSGTVLEVLSAHLRVLLECPFYSCPPSLIVSPLDDVAMLRKQMGKRRGVQAQVTAKSPIMGTGKNARFLLEISSVAAKTQDDVVAVIVVFVGTEALQWWPFLHIGSTLVFLGLKCAKLPDFGDKFVFKVSDSSANIYVLEQKLGNDKIDGGDKSATSASLEARTAVNISALAPTAKRMRRSATTLSTKKQTSNAEPALRADSNWNQHFVTYQGVITDVLSDGRLCLDNAVYLHLGGAYGWCTGGSKAFVCFRVGARIEALNVLIAFQRGIPTTIFPTARTNINIVYFGNVPEKGIVRTREWHRSPWVRYWNHLAAPHILWAQELYDALPRKFRVWLEPTQSQSPEFSCTDSQISSDLACRLLGSEQDVGLIEYLMDTLAGTGKLFQRNQAPTHVYSDFLEGNHSLQSKWDKNIPSFPYPATLAELSAAVDVKWRASPCAKASRNAAVENASASRVLVEVFSEKDLAAVLHSPQLCGRRGPAARGKRQCGGDIVLIGMLEGCSDDVGTAQVSDATGSIYVELVGNLDPSLLGAVVVVQSFQVAVEHFPHFEIRNTTFLIECSKMKVLIDGPFVDFHCGERYDMKNDTQLPVAHSGFPSRNASVRIHVSQSRNNEFVSSACQGCDYDEYPLVAIFVEMISSTSLHSDGQPRFRVQGQLVGFCQNRGKSIWKQLRDKHDGFWSCCLVVHGNAASKVRACLREGQLYAVGCSDFGGCTDIQALCEKRAQQASKNARPVLLFSASVLNGLWIEDLRRGAGMRCKRNDVSEIENIARHASEIEGLAQRFQLWASQSVMQMLSQNWRSSTVSADHFAASTDRGDDLVSICGVFLYADMPRRRSDVRNRGGTEECTDFRLVLREKEASVLVFHVLFFATESKPRGLVPGSTLQVFNVLRRTTIGDSNILFIACDLTRIGRVTIGGFSNSMPSPCCHRPLLKDKNIFETFPPRFLWSFCPGAIDHSQSRASCAFGVLRVNLIELKRIEFFVNYHSAACRNCKSEDDADWCAGAHAAATVEDGTAKGEIECNSFQAVMELLGASRRDSLAFRRELPRWQPSRDALTNWKIQSNPLCMSENGADIVLRDLLISFPRPVYMLAKNLKCVQGGLSGTNSSTIDQAEVRGHSVGFGRKLWSAESSRMHQVQLEALAVFEENFWLASKVGGLDPRCMSVKERYDGTCK